MLSNMSLYKVKKLDRWVAHELNAHRFDACVSLLLRSGGLRNRVFSSKA